MRKTEALAARLTKEPKEKSEPAKPFVDYSAEVEKELGDILGRRVHLVSGKKNGRIEIEFYGADDRENLIERLRRLR